MRSYVERGGVWECGKVNWRVEAVSVEVQLQFGDVREQTNEEEEIGRASCRERV